MKFGKLTLKRSSKDAAPSKPTIKRPKQSRTILFQDGLAALSVAAFLFFAATAREVNLLLALAALFGGFVALDYFWGRRTLRRLRVSRKTPDSVFAGEPFYVAIEIQNVGKRASWAVVVEDDWAAETPRFDVDSLKISNGAQNIVPVSTSDNTKALKTSDVPKAETTLRPIAYFPKIVGGETRKECYSGVVSRRGTRRLTALTASTRFPCGFFRSWERFDAPTEITVFPKTGVLTNDWDVFAGDVVSDATVSTGRSSRIPDETLTVRDWRSGDPKKAIHWRATAKRDRLQARDFEERKSQTIFLLLDLLVEKNIPSDDNGGDSKKRGKKDSFQAFRRWENVELAVSFAATLLQRWARSGDARFFFAVNGDDSAAAEETPKESRWEKSSKVKSSVAPVGWENSDWSEGTGGGALRNFLTRLATANEPRRDRLAEIFAEADPQTLAEAQIFVVSVAPFDFKRLSPSNVEKPENNATQGNKSWSNARFVDVSSDVFSQYFIV